MKGNLLEKHLPERQAAARKAANISTYPVGRQQQARSLTDAYFPTRSREYVA